MFEIKCLVSDKKLAEVLNSLGGLTLEPPVVEPVLKLAKPAGATAEVAIMEFIKDNNPKQITTKDMRALTIAAGYSNNGYSYALKMLLKKKVLKKSRTPAVYEVSHG